MLKKLLIIIFYLLNLTCFGQSIEFNRPQITFLFSNSSSKNPELNNYVDYISTHQINSNIVQIANGSNIIINSSNLEFRDYLRYKDSYVGTLPFFNQVEYNQVSNPKINFSIDDINKNKNNLLLKTVNDIFKFIFNVGYDGQMKLDRFYSRAILNAKNSDKILAENVARGNNIITDNILKLTNQMYIVVIQYENAKIETSNYLKVKSKVAVYRVDFSKILNSPIFWKNFNNRVQGNILGENDFNLYLVKTTTIKSVAKNTADATVFNSLFYQDLEQFFNNVNDQFGVSTPIVSTSPITAEISYEKDGVIVGDIFKVCYQKQKSNGKVITKKVGYIKAMKVGNKSFNTKYYTLGELTTFSKYGVRGVQNGMTIKKVNRHWVSYGMEYGLTQNSILSGPIFSLSIMPATSRITLFFNVFNGITTSEPIDFNGYQKTLNGGGFNLGLKYEKPISLNYFELSPFLGFCGAFVIQNSFEDTQGNKYYPPSSNLLRGITGLRLAVNIGPYFQLFSNLNYDFKISTSTSEGQFPNIKDQINKTLNPESISYTFGFRIR